MKTATLMPSSGIFEPMPRAPLRNGLPWRRHAKPVFAGGRRQAAPCAKAAVGCRRGGQLGGQSRRLGARGFCRLSASGGESAFHRRSILLQRHAGEAWAHPQRRCGGSRLPGGAGRRLRQHQSGPDLRLAGAERSRGAGGLAAGHRPAAGALKLVSVDHRAEDGVRPPSTANAGGRLGRPHGGGGPGAAGGRRVRPLRGFRLRPGGCAVPAQLGLLDLWRLRWPRRRGRRQANPAPCLRNRQRARQRVPHQQAPSTAVCICATRPAPPPPPSHRRRCPESS